MKETTVIVGKYLTTYLISDKYRELLHYSIDKNPNNTPAEILSRIFEGEW